MIYWIVCLLVIIFTFTPFAHATNGMNIIGFGPLGLGIGGADVALLGACSPIASNPANLIQVCDRSLSIGSSFLYPRLRLKTDPSPGQKGNNRASSHQVFAFPFTSMAVKLNDRLGIGVGVFVQGGMGVNFKDLNTIFDTRDEIKSQVRFGRLSPTIVYSPTERLSVGLSVKLGYADVGYKFFPATSLYRDEMVFFGQELRGARSTTFSITTGVNYKLTQRIRLGIDVTTKSSLDLKAGKLLVNMEGLGLGMVRYDAEVKDFTWPAQLRMGLSVRPASKIKLAFELRHIWWKEALGTIRVKGRDPHGGGTTRPPDFKAKFPFRWRNQWVAAFGGEIQATPNILIRFGYNHGDNPIRSRYLSPLFPATVEDHVSLGVRFACPCVKGTAIDLAYVHAFTTEEKVEAPSLIAGEDLRIKHVQDTLGLFFTKKF